ncbi:MAG: hypothetical protein HXY30_05525 [Pseudorhodoplanes sp.]|nr:hypothetical protein [Pseudorhodoplanes sp.]
MNNSSLTSADRATHVKIVAVSLIAGMLVIGVGIAARSDLGVATGAKGQLEATGPIIKVGKPTAITSSGTSAVR